MTGFIEHQGQRIYLIDIAGLAVDQVVLMLDKAAREIRVEPPASVRTLVHVAGVEVTAAIVSKLSSLASGNRPYVRASVVAGLTPAQKVVLDVIRALAGREFHLTRTLEEALAYLATVP